MTGSKKFGVWCIVAALVALCLGMLAGTATVSAQEVTPPAFVQPPVLQPPVVVQPPVIVQPPAMNPPVPMPPVLQPPVVVPPPVVVQPPVMADLQLYQQYLGRLLQINASIAMLTMRINTYEVVAAVDPEDPFIQYELQMMWGQLYMLQLEQTEVRFVLSTLTP